MNELAKKQDVARIHDEAQAPLAVEEETAGSLMAVITSAAKDPSVDVDKLERLMGLYERVEARRAEAAYAAAMVAAKAEMPAVVRDAENKHTKSRYSRLETVAAAIDPIINRHGFAISYNTFPSTLQSHYGVEARVTHKEGHHEIHRTDVPADLAGAQGKANKNPTQGFGSTLSYGRRYLKLMIFDVVTKDMDDDGNAASGAITQEQVEELVKICDDAGLDKARVCAHYEIEGFADIPAVHFQKVKGAILTKAKASKK